MEGIKFGLLLILGLICLAKSEKEVTKSKETTRLINNFEKINKYLEKNIDSNDVELMVAEAKRKQRKLNFFDGKSLMEAYEIFLGLPEMVNAKNCSVLAAFNFRYIDIGIDDSHLKLNHKLRPIDLVAQYYGYKFVDLCQLGFLRKTDFIFRENHYQQVNKLLAEAGETLDTHNEMVKVEQLYELYKKEEENGSLTDVLRRILALKQTQNEDSCDTDAAFNIISKNSLGLGEADPQKVGRIKMIVDHYAKHHAKVCKPFFQAKFETVMKQMDKSLFEILVTISASYFRSRYILKDLDTNAIGSYAELRGKLLEHDNLKLLSEHKDWTHLSADGTELEAIDYYTILRDLVDRGKVLNGEVDRANVVELFNENLFVPCQRFIRNSGNLYKKLNYDAKNLEQYFGNSEEEFEPWVGVYFFEPAYKTCKEVGNFPKLTIDKILNTMQPEASA